MKLRDDEVKRLIAHLRSLVTEDELRAIEDQLRSDEGPKRLSRGDLDDFFPQLSFDVRVGSETWVLRIIPHARMRMVQRGVQAEEVTRLFERFIQVSQQRGEVLTLGRYEIIGRVRRGKRLTVRADIDEIETATGKAHVVTVYLGSSGGDESVVNVDVG
jgi:hypothetical protein